MPICVIFVYFIPVIYIVKELNIIKSLIDDILSQDISVATNATKEYLSCIEDLIYLPEVQKLDALPQHGDLSRLYHSICVSYRSFLICRVLHLDARAAARAGLLHDFFMYDRLDYIKEKNHKNHTFAHPLTALDNARTVTDLSQKEENIIASHMFPLCIHMPCYAESFIVSYVDKMCALSEAFSFLFSSTTRVTKRLTLRLAVMLHMY